MIGAVYEQREQIKGLHTKLRQGGGARAAAVTLEQVTWLGLGLGLRLGLGVGIGLAAPRATAVTLEQVSWAEQVVYISAVSPPDLPISRAGDLGGAGRVVARVRLDARQERAGGAAAAAARQGARREEAAHRGGVA